MFNDVFKKLVDKTGKSVNMISKEIGLSQSLLSKYMHGVMEPLLANLQKFSDYFGVSVDYLLEKEGSPEEENVKKIFFSITKEAAEKGLTPDDVKKAIEIFKQYKK